MKTLGVIRKADKLGRLVLPKHFRDELNRNTETPLEISSDGKNVIITRYEKGCVLCGSDENVTLFEDKPICEGCIVRLQK